MTTMKSKTTATAQPTDNEKGQSLRQQSHQPRSESEKRLPWGETPPFTKSVDNAITNAIIIIVV